MRPSLRITAQATDDLRLACPLCHISKLEVESQLSCDRCQLSFPRRTDFLDLTIPAGESSEAGPSLGTAGMLGQELFRTQQVSYLYERGWRQGFRTVGFPGLEAEMELALDFFAPALGGNLIDMSCGSGLFSRAFAASGRFKHVVAVDYSESMLRQARSYIEDAGGDSGVPAPCEISLVRADVGRLPFQTGSQTAIHAAAAIHCWPDPRLAMAELSRVMAPGAVFVGSTFLTPLTATLGSLVGDNLVRPFKSFDLVSRAISSAGIKAWEEEELREICESVGLVGFKCTRSRMFIMFTARKPSSSL